MAQGPTPPLLPNRCRDKFAHGIPLSYAFGDWSLVFLWSLELGIWSFLRITNAFATVLSCLSDGEFITFPSSQNVDDPPPSRFIASVQPNSFINPANSSRFMPI